MLITEAKTTNIQKSANWLDTRNQLRYMLVNNDSIGMAYVHDWFAPADDELLHIVTAVPPHYRWALLGATASNKGSMESRPTNDLPPAAITSTYIVNWPPIGLGGLPASQ
jgi:hypothetical protein